MRFPKRILLNSIHIYFDVFQLRYVPNTNTTSPGQSTMSGSDQAMDCGDTALFSYTPLISSGYSDRSSEETDSRATESESCTVCGDKATKYRYSHYGQYQMLVISV